MNKQKLRLAVIVHGGVNAGYKGQGFPALVALLKELHKKTDLTIYTFSKPSIKNELNVKHIPDIKFFRELMLLLIFFFNRFDSTYDVVHGFWGFPSGRIAAFIGKKFNISSVATIMGGEVASIEEIGYGHLRTEKGIRKVRGLLDTLSTTIYLSKYQLNQLRAKGIELADNMIQINFGLKSESIAKKKREETGTKLIHVGNINEVKDYTTLLKAFVEIRKTIDATLTIVGGDFMNGNVQQQAVTLGIEEYIEFTGQLCNEKSVEKIKESDLVLVSSLSEGQLVVFNEAMSVGVPVCGTDVGLLHDLSGTHCLTSPIRDYQVLAKNAIKLLSDKHLYSKFVEAGYKWSLENDLEACTRKHLELYNSLLRNIE